MVNCAGFGAIMPLTELPGEKWRSVHAVTLGGVFYGVKHGARQMLEQGRPGVIINISSVNARQPMEANSAYCAAKAGVDMITRCGALELGPRGIRVVGIAPGLVETPLTRNELDNPAIRDLFMAVIPMKRAVEAEEIAAAAIFLASEHGRSINGETIAIDGGLLTRGTPALLTGLNERYHDRLLDCRRVFLIPSRFVITTNVSVLSRRPCWQERAILPRCRHLFRSTPPMYLL